jgi:Ca2+/Na+ antiporter
MSSTDAFWANDFSVLLLERRLSEFFPSKNLTFHENLNAGVRLGLYLSVILALFYQDLQYLSILLFAFAFTYFLFRFYTPMNEEKRKEEEIIETMDMEADCTKPTEDNPFMNFTMYDHLTFNSDKKPACDVKNEDIKREMKSNFDTNLYKDISDVFDRRNSQRQFFTMPWTTVVNDQKEFANWLYKSESTCKENNDYCLRYEDLRSKRSPVD